MRTERVTTNLACSQNCGFCDARAPRDAPAFVRAEAVVGRIEAALSSGARELVLTGGEPTLRADLASLVAAARSTGARVVLETNAAGIGPGTAAALAKAGLSVARVHVPAWGDEADGITRDPGGFSRALAGMEHLGAAGVAVELQIPIVHDNLRLVADIPARAVTSGLPVRALNLVVPLDARDRTTLASAREAALAVTGIAEAARAVGLAVRLDARCFLPPCLFERPDRVAHLYALNRGGAERAGYLHLEPCGGCAARAVCPGVPEALHARDPITPNPIHEDRTRRRLTVISTVEEQIRRELVAKEVVRRSGGAEAAIPAHTVRVNFHCNQSCHFCFVSTHLPPPDDAAVRAAVIEGARAGGIVALSGGEPTLNPRLLDYVRLARQEGALQVDLQTNAVRLGEGTLVRDLEAAGLQHAMISLHGSCAAVSDEVTAAPGTFERTLRGIDQVAASSILLRLNFVFCEANRDDFPATVRLVAGRWPRASLVVSFVGSHTDVVPRSRALIPRYLDVVPPLVEGLAIARAAGIEVSGLESMCGVPLCLVPGPERAPFAMAELPAGAADSEFVRADECARCALSSRCYGVRRGYAELHGTGELRAVTAEAAPSQADPRRR